MKLPVFTGLRGKCYIQGIGVDKKKAYNDIVALAEKDGGIIERPYLCILYVAKRK